MATTENIELVHFPELDEVDAALAEKCMTKSMGKVTRISQKQDLKLKIQVRKYHRSGGRKEYEVHCRFNDPEVKLFSTAKSWNFLSALEDSLKTLEGETVKRFKR